MPLSHSCSPDAPVWHIGLTGGIGSGKSTVSRMLAACGACVMDADTIARACTAPGGHAIAPIRARFGADFIDNSGALDRVAMRELAFREPQARQQLEAIVHPLVLQEIERQAAAAMQASYRVLVYDIPLLAESAHWRKRLAHVAVVDCDAATQVQRVMQRNALTQQAVQAIITSQASRSQRAAIADSILQNGAGICLDALQAQVAAWARHFGLIIGTKGNAA